MRFLGAILVAAGCAGVGVHAAMELKARVGLLRRLCAGLEVMERELSLGRTPLPELLEGLEEELFRAAARGLAQGLGLRRAWDGALDASSLPPEDREVLRPLGRVLGRYDAPGQEESVEHVRRDLERRLAQAREESSRLGRMYAALGVTAGIFLAVMLA